MQYIIRAALIACGNQWFEIHAMDLVLTRRRRLQWLQLYMVLKTMAGAFFSCYTKMVHPGDPVWTAALYLSDLILVIGGYAFFVYTFSDDPVFVLGLHPIAEGLAVLCMLLVSLVNRLEGRTSDFEIMGPLKPLDILMPVLCIAAFYILRPLVSRFLHYIKRVYLPHRSLQKALFFSFFLYSRLPTILDKNLGDTWGVIVPLHMLLILAIGTWLVRSDIQTQKQERRLLNMQFTLLERRTYLAAQISGKAEKLRSEISMQMQQLQTDMNLGNTPDREILENYAQKLRELRIEKPRGIYCEDVLVDEVLTQIHEEAVSRGMDIRIHLWGYEPEKVPEEDLVQILYYLWKSCMSDGGTLDIEMLMTGKELMIRFISSMIRITRGKNTAIRSIARRYQGQVRVKMTGNKYVSVWLKIPDQTI